MVKRIAVDVGLGVSLFVLVMVAELLVTLPSGSAAEGSDLASALNREFLLTALPALVLSTALAWWAHTPSPGHGMGLGLVWALVLGLFYLSIGVGNGTSVMFATGGMWLMLAAVVAGATLAGWLPRRRRRQRRSGNDSAALRTRLT